MVVVVIWGDESSEGGEVAQARDFDYGGGDAVFDFIYLQEFVFPVYHGTSIFVQDFGGADAGGVGGADGS